MLGYNLLSSENAGLDHRFFEDVCAHDRVLASHDSGLALALLQSLFKALGEERCDLGKVCSHNGSRDDFCVADRVDDLLRLFDVGVSYHVIDDLFLIVVVDEEQRILMLFVYDINEGVNDITKNDLIAAVVQKFCNKPSSDLACAKVYCFFHILFSFLERT